MTATGLLKLGLALTLCVAAAGCGSENAAPTHAVTYDGNGNTSGTPPIDSARYRGGNVVTALANSGGLARTGFTFAGWNSRTDGLGTTYGPGQRFTIGPQAVTLYALWTAADYWKHVVNLPPQFTIDDASMHVGADGRMLVVGWNMPAHATQFLRVDTGIANPITVALASPEAYTSMALSTVGRERFFSGVNLETKTAYVARLVDAGGTLVAEDTDFPVDIQYGATTAVAGPNALYLVGLTSERTVRVFEYRTAGATRLWTELPAVDTGDTEVPALFAALDTDGTIYVAYMDAALPTQNVIIQALPPGASSWETLPPFPGASGWVVFALAVRDGRVFLAVDNRDDKTISGYLYTASDGWRNFYVPILPESSYVSGVTQSRAGELYLQVCSRAVSTRCSIFAHDFTDTGAWSTLGPVGFAPDLTIQRTPYRVTVSEGDVPYYFYPSASAATYEIGVLAYVDGTPGDGRPAAEPVFSVPPGSYPAPQYVTLSSATGNATLYYTTDGSDPSTSPTRRVYVDELGLAIDRTTLLRAVAIKRGYQRSALTEGTFTITKVTPPVFGQAAGGYVGTQALQLSCQPPDAAIFYTTDGTDPATSSTRQRYVDAVTLTSSAVVRAVGERSGYTTSEVAAATYYVFEPALGGYRGQVQDVQEHDGTLYMVTFDKTYEDGTSWLYRLGADRTWTELASRTPFWGRSIAIGDARLYLGGIDPSFSGVVLRYEDGVLTQEGDTISECDLYTVATLTGALYAGCAATRVEETYRLDGAEWRKIADVGMGSPVVHDGRLYSTAVTGVYRTGEGEELVPLPYSGLVMIPRRLRSVEGHLQLISEVNGMFALGDADVIYSDFVLPFPAGLLNYYFDFAYVDGTYSIVAPRTLTRVTDKQIGASITLEPPGAGFTHIFAFDGVVYPVINGLLHTVVFPSP